MFIRPVRTDDRDSWLRMRHALWPEAAKEHAGDIDRYFAGQSRDPLEVLLVFDERGTAMGFVELSIRAYAEGCETDRVAFVEGGTSIRMTEATGSVPRSLARRRSGRGHKAARRWPRI